MNSYDPAVGTEVRLHDSRIAVTSPELGFDIFKGFGMTEAEVEECWMLLLDTRHRLIDSVMVSRGSIDHTFMSPRDVYRIALQHNAAALLLGHNHPSGDPEPSRDDERVTRRLADAGELMGVDLLDHLVVARNGWTSLARKGHT